MDKPSGNTRKTNHGRKEALTELQEKQKQLENSYYRFESLKKVMKKNDINKQAKGISCSKRRNRGKETMDWVL